MEPIKNTEKKRPFIHVFVLLICMSLVYNSNSYVLIMFLFIMCYMLYNYKVEDLEKMFIEYTGYTLDSKTLENDPEKLIDSKVKKLDEANSDLSFKKLIKTTDEKFKKEIEGKTDEEIAVIARKYNAIFEKLYESKISELGQPLVDDCSSCQWEIDMKNCVVDGKMDTTCTSGVICTSKTNKMLAYCRPGICTADQIKKVNIDGKEKSFVGSCNPEHLVDYKKDYKEGLNKSDYQAILDAKRSEG